MTVTYPADPNKPYGDRIEAPILDAARDEPFVPVYARSSKAAGRGKIRTWMILAPVGAVFLGGIAVALMMDGRADAPPVEPAATALVPQATAPLTETAATPLITDAIPAPVVREPAPVRRVAPAAATARDVAPRTEATVSPRAVAPAPASAPVVGPQPYVSAPAGPTPPAPTPAPIIVVAPQG